MTLSVLFLKRDSGNIQTALSVFAIVSTRDTVGKMFTLICLVDTDASSLYWIRHYRRELPDFRVTFSIHVYYIIRVRRAYEKREYPMIVIMLNIKAISDGNYIVEKT